MQSETILRSGASSLIACRRQRNWRRDVSGNFSPEQKRYLEGFVSGLNAARATRGTLPAGKAEPVGPDAMHLKAQDRVTAAGGKLAEQEKFKREQHPFDAYHRLKAQADANEP